MRGRCLFRNAILTSGRRNFLDVDFRKGMLSVLQADDQLMHLQWKDRGTGTVEVSSYVYASQMSS